MIKKLVAELPEVYQPIYGHPELSARVSRSCVDRLVDIARVHDAMQALLGRPIRVLDLGCAQGYFSLNLAARGAIVTGVDFLDKNIAVCNALAAENAELQIDFKTARVEEAIKDLQPLQYDLVLGLSVFHHIVHEKGTDAVKALLEHAAAQSGLLLLELALREEPLYWGPAQPADPQLLLDGIAFVQEFARHGTHLASVARPLFVASNRYWVLGDLAASFDHWSSDPHALARGTHQGSRRYFIGSQSVLKTYRFDQKRAQHNIAEFEAETGFLRAPPSGFAAPRLIAYGRTENTAWIAVEKLPGRLLLDALHEGAVIKSRDLLLGVLQQLAALEAAGLYHDDVRTWNVLLSEDGVTHLIDFGSISNKPEDCVWPRNPYLSFFIFVREVVTGVVDDPVPLRTIAVSPFGLPQPYRAWITAFWSMPVSEWSFNRLYQLLLAHADGSTEAPALQPLELWMTAIEEALQAHLAFGKHMLSEHHARVNQCELIAQQAEAKVQQAEAKIQQAEAKVQQAEAKAHQAECFQKESLLQLQAMHSSLSWRITAPLRFAAGVALKTGVVLRTSANRALYRAMEFGQRPLARLMAVVLRKPFVAQRINTWLMRFPPLYQHLLSVAQRQGVVPGLLLQGASHLAAKPVDQTLVTDLAHLTPRARQIYADLKQSIENNKRRG